MSLPKINDYDEIDNLVLADAAVDFVNARKAAWTDLLSRYRAIGPDIDSLRVPSSAEEAAGNALRNLRNVALEQYFRVHRNRGEP